MQTCILYSPTFSGILTTTCNPWCWSALSEAWEASRAHLRASIDILIHGAGAVVKSVISIAAFELFMRYDPACLWIFLIAALNWKS